MLSVKIRSIAALILLSVVTSACCSRQGKITRDKQPLDVRKEKRGANEELIAHSKDLMLRGEFGEGFSSLVSIDYKNCSPNQQRQCEVLLEYWKKHRDYIPSGFKMPPWHYFSKFLALDAETAKLKSDRVCQLNLEMQLRDYQKAAQVLKSLNLETLEETDRSYCQACSRVLELAFPQNTIDKRERGE